MSAKPQAGTSAPQEADNAPSQGILPTLSGRRLITGSTVFLIGLFLTILVFQLALDRDRDRIRDNFTHEAETQSLELLKNIHNYQQVLIALKVLFHYSNEVTREEFHGAAIDLTAYYPGIQALEWIPQILHSEREPLIAQSRLEGYTEFNINDKQDDGSFTVAAEREHYWPIVFVEPVEGNRVIMGYDLSGAPTLDVLKDARDSGEMRATQAFQLGQEINGQLGWVIICPVYNSIEVPGTTAERRAQFKGFLEGVFRLPDMLNATWGTTEQGSLDTIIVDITDGQQVIYSHSGDSRTVLDDINLTAPASTLQHIVEADILGRSWAFYFRPSPVWLEKFESPAPLFFLGSGLVTTLLISGLIYFQLRRTEVIEGLVADRTEELTIGNERLQLALRSGKMCAWEWDVIKGHFNTISIDPHSRCHEVYQTQTRKRFLANIHEDDQKAVEEAGEMMITGEISAYSREFRITVENGQLYWIAEHALSLRNKQGKCRKIIGIARDISDEKEAELELAAHLASEQQARSQAEQAEREKNDALILLDTVFSSAPVGLSVFDTDCHYVRANNTICELMGRTQEQIVGHPIAEILGPTSTRIEPLLRKVLQTGRPLVNYELEAETPGFPGKIRYWLANYYPVFSNSGELQGVGAVIIDITEKREAEIEIHASSERFQLLAKATHDAVWDWDIKTGTIWRNDAGAACLPEHDGEVTDFDIWQDALHIDDRERVVNSMLAAVAGQGQEWQESYRTISPDNKVAFVFNRGYIVRDIDGKAVRVIGAKTDVTEQKEFEQRIHQLNAELEKRVELRTAELRMALDELESFSYSVSHDLRAPLRTVNGFASIMQEDQAQLSEDNRHYLTRICNASQHMDRLITDLLRLARISRQGMEFDEVDITAMAHEIVTELRTEFTSHNPEVKIADGLTAHCDSGLIRILLTNLIGNAFKFTRKAADPRIELLRVEDSDKGACCFLLSDNGAGFDMQYSKQLFSPFRRLHSAEEFEGTGIGLATVRRIVRRHAGDITAESTLGKGARFTFWLNS